MILKILVLLIAPLSIDIFNLFLALRRNRRRKGASPVPIIALFLSGYLIFNPSVEIGIGFKILLFIATIFIHIMLVFIIPLIDNKFLEKK